MDPYLEGTHWVSVHAELCIRLIDQIDEQLPDNYTVVPEKYLVVETIAETEQSFQPDVSIRRFREPTPSSTPPSAEVSAPTLTIPAPQPRAYQQTFFKILELETSDVVTVIELLSPANKVDVGLSKFKRKRAAFHENGVHFLEIDLIRRGKRTIEPKQLLRAAPFDYLASLYRANSSAFEVWTFSLADAIPRLPVPLLVGDADVVIDTQRALDTIYQRRKYGKQIDYGSDAPPPKLSWRPEIDA